MHHEISQEQRIQFDWGTDYVAEHGEPDREKQVSPR